MPDSVPHLVVRNVQSARQWADDVLSWQRGHGPRDRCDVVDPRICWAFLGFTLDTSALEYDERMDLCEQLYDIGPHMRVSNDYGGPMKCGYAAHGAWQFYHYFEL